MNYYKSVSGKATLCCSKNIENENWIKITKQQYIDIVCKQPTEQDLIRQQIECLKQELESTDYKAIKYFEGLISEQDYEPIRQDRQYLRNQINELESKL